MVVMISQLSDLLKKMIQLSGQHYANKQWGLQTNATMSGAPIILPLTAKILRGVVCDGGNYNNPCGFDANAGKIYASNTAVAFIVLCR